MEINMSKSLNDLVVLHVFIGRKKIIKWHYFNGVIVFNVLINSVKANIIILIIIILHCWLHYLICMFSTHCTPVAACHIRLAHFAAAIKCRDLVSGIGYSTVPYFGPLARFWHSSMTPSNWWLTQLSIVDSWRQRSNALDSYFSESSSCF